MTLTTARSSRLATLVASLAIVAAACTPAASTAPSVGGTTPTAAPSTAAYDGISYPSGGDASCTDKTTNTSEFKSIKALDQYTVEFDLCSPDAAFLQKIAFATNSIESGPWLDAHAADKSDVRSMNGTGPYMFKEWVSGDHITMVANPNYWGTQKAQASTLIFKWEDTAAKRLQDLQAGTADGIDNVDPQDYATVTADSSLALVNRDAFTILYLGFNVDDAPWNNEQVREAISYGIDKKRLNDTFDPPGSATADYFAACSVPGGCTGDPFPQFDPAKAKSMLQAAGFDFSKHYKIYFRPKVRGYFPNPPAMVQDLQAQFQANMGISLDISQEDNATYLTNSSKGQYSLFLLGWGGDFPDQTDWVGYHFGAGANDAFGTKFSDITGLLDQAVQNPDQNARIGLYGQVNSLLAKHVPMIPLVHAGSAMAWKSDVTGVKASPLGIDLFAYMNPAGRDTLVFEQNSETSGLYCGDESDGDSLRNCENVYDTLYEYSYGGTDVQPALATACTANSDATVWTCTLRQGVKFADGSDFSANDVVTTFAAQWDTKHKDHVGNGGTFDYWSALFNGFLNPPAS